MCKIHYGWLNKQKMCYNCINFQVLKFSMNCSDSNLETDQNSISDRLEMAARLPNIELLIQTENIIQLFI